MNDFIAIDTQENVFVQASRCNRMVAHYLFDLHFTLKVRRFGVLETWRLGKHPLIIRP